MRAPEQRHWRILRGRIAVTGQGRSDGANLSALNGQTWVERRGCCWLTGALRMVRLIFAIALAHASLTPLRAQPAEAPLPTITRIPELSLSGLVQLNPSYSRAAMAHATILGAFEITEPPGVHLVDATSMQWLPIFMWFSDGQCYSLDAQNVGGSLTEGSVSHVRCSDRPKSYQPANTPLSPNPSWRLIGYPWGYAAWADDSRGSTIVSAPPSIIRGPAEPLFTVRMEPLAIMAMNGPDYPGGTVTLVGRRSGRLLAVILDVTY